MRVERTQHICVPFRLSTHAEPETYRWFTAERRAYDRKVEMAITSKTANKTERKAQGLAKGPVAAAQPNLMLTDDDIHLFGTGMWQRAWEKMGAHKDVQGNSEGWLFRVWAPQDVYKRQAQGLGGLGGSLLIGVNLGGALGDLKIHVVDEHLVDLTELKHVPVSYTHLADANIAHT